MRGEGKDISLALGSHPGERSHKKKPRAGPRDHRQERKAAWFWAASTVMQRVLTAHTTFSEGGWEWLVPISQWSEV